MADRGRQRRQPCRQSGFGKHTQVPGASAHCLCWGFLRGARAVLRRGSMRWTRASWRRLAREPESARVVLELVVPTIDAGEGITERGGEDGILGGGRWSATGSGKHWLVRVAGCPSARAGTSSQALARPSGHRGCCGSGCARCGRTSGPRQGSCRCRVRWRVAEGVEDAGRS